MGRDRNRELVEEYPWLDIGYEQLTLLDTLPRGWHDLILDMCKEIKKELVKSDSLPINFPKVYGSDSLLLLDWKT